VRQCSRLAAGARSTQRMRQARAAASKARSPPCQCYGVTACVRGRGYREQGSGEAHRGACTSGASSAFPSAALAEIMWTSIDLQIRSDKICVTTSQQPLGFRTVGRFGGEAEEALVQRAVPSGTRTGAAGSWPGGARARGRLPARSWVIAAAGMAAHWFGRGGTHALSGAPVGARHAHGRCQQPAQRHAGMGAAASMHPGTG